MQLRNMVIFDLYILLLNTITRIKPQKYGYSFIYLCIYLNRVLLGFLFFIFWVGGGGEGLLGLWVQKKILNSFLRFNGWIQNYSTFFSHLNPLLSCVFARFNKKSHSQEFYNSIGKSMFSTDMSKIIIPSFAVN